MILLPTARVRPGKVLLPYQHCVARDFTRFKIWLASRQIGKSFTLAAEAVSDCLYHPGSTWVVLSVGERQALVFMEKVKAWAKMYKLALYEAFEERRHSKALLKSTEIRWANGSRIIALPANASTARGYSANLILDEFAFHDNPAEIWRGIYPSISNPLKQTYKLRIASTANGRNNKFFELWDKPNGYAKYRTTIHDAVADGLAAKSGLSNEAFLAELKAGLDDPAGWAQEFECDFMDLSNVLLPYDIIAQAESADAQEVADPSRWDTGSRSAGGGSGHPLYLGIDFGRSNDPTVCWTLEQIGSVFWTREILVLKDMPTPEQEEILAHRIRCATRVCFDYTGPGIGLGDHLVKPELGFNEWLPSAHRFGKVELCQFSANFKRELFPKLRRAFEAPVNLRIPVSCAVREDLHAMQQVVNNGEYNYWAPHTREGHSDRCTALALAFRAGGNPAQPFSSTLC